MAQTRFQAIFQPTSTVTYQDTATGSKYLQVGIWEVCMFNVIREAGIVSSSLVVGHVLHRVLTHELAIALVQAYENNKDLGWLN